MENKIVMIPVDQLHHHPENPRLDLGDLTELTESIRQNGIMQNLTVIPGHCMTKDEFIQMMKAEGVPKYVAEDSYDPADAWVSDGYTVVIGNRRMEASQLAGLEELPCVIREMDHRTQISTMLTENMQRADLTVYEQAMGFQMMMDLGYSPKEISEKSGFSETTVSRRLKMAELDRIEFRKACGKQITIDDLDRLGKIESVEKRNELLKEYGENNFDWKLNMALKEQQAKKVWPKALEILKEAKIKSCEKENTWQTGWRKLYKETLELDKWDGKRKFIPKTDDPLFYYKNGVDIDFYVKEKKKKEPAVKKTPEEIEEEKRIALAWKTAERITETATELRRNYAKTLKVSPKNAMEMMQWAMIAALCSMLSYDSPSQTFRKAIPLTSYNYDDIMDEIRKWIMEMPQSKWPEVIMMLFDGDKRAEVIGYVDGPKYIRPKYKKNRKLDLCYEWLTQFGYQMSDEEIQIMSGTHPVFQEAMKI